VTIKFFCRFNHDFCKLTGGAICASKGWEVYERANFIADGARHVYVGLTMIKPIKRLETCSKPSLAAASLGIVAVVGWVDYATGYEIFFFIFYLFAIFLAAWCVSTSFGVIISALSVTAWVSTNIASGQRYPDYFVPVWNAVIMFLFYLVVVVLLAKLRNLQGNLESRVSERTAALSREIAERTRLQKELLETAEQQQQRIGGELHDNLCQHLTGTAFAGHALSQKLAEKSLPETAAAGHLVELIEAAIELTRQVARGLQPIEMKNGGIADNFQEFAATVSERFKISCRFECQQAVPLLDPNVATHLLRIAQEAVNNAIRHGKAAQINICLHSERDGLILTITDDGGGLPENALDHNGLGLRLMAYRAEMIGATFSVERLATQGTRVTCSRPAKPVPDIKNNASKN
jgi:signal transduction histidine kinase